MQVRSATDHDVPGILAIYNDAVLHTTAIWNDRVVDAADRSAWLAARQAAGFPVLVATDHVGCVLGYASFGEWRAWDGYRHTVEHSIYVAAEYRRGGVGSTLLTALIGRARDAGKHTMVAGIEAGNAASIALHERLGFTRAGLLHGVGTKFGAWLDLAFLQLILDGRARP